MSSSSSSSVRGWLRVALDSLDSSKGRLFQQKKREVQHEEDELKVGKAFPFEYVDEEQNQGMFMSIQMPELVSDCQR